MILLLLVVVVVVVFNFQFYFWLFTIFYRAIGLMSRAFANDPEDQGSIPGCVIPKTQKIALDAAWLNTQH